MGASSGAGGEQATEGRPAGSGRQHGVQEGAAEPPAERLLLRCARVAALVEGAACVVERVRPVAVARATQHDCEASGDERTHMRVASPQLTHGAASAMRCSCLERIFCDVMFVSRAAAAPSAALALLLRSAWNSGSCCVCASFAQS
eukprot:4151823-Prymnesium_polylepis.1